MIQSARFWMLFPVVLLLASVGLGVGTVMLAAGDPSVIAIKKLDYDDQGDGVDERLAAESISRALGWKVRFVSRLFSIDSADALALRVVDANGEPLLGVSGEVRAFHNAFPDQVLAAKLREDAQRPGIYLLDLDLENAGYWNFSVELTREEDHFIADWKSRFVEQLP